ncbi:phasin family protein [Aquilutibacter rugosus]|uniref:phasin family protein n=1 Tax=Aquilutibacter rugosus TaxID=3115820 RepID=UPI002F40F99A
MNLQFNNEQFSAATRQFADTAAKINTIAIESAQAVFTAQLNAVQERATATFAFLTEAAQVRDLETAKTLWPKGVQVARENVERAVSTTQEVAEKTTKAAEQLGLIAKGQFEDATAKAEQAVQKVTKAVRK